MRNDCTVGKLSECNEAGNEEAIRRRNRSCAATVGVVCLESELEMDGPLTGFEVVQWLMFLSGLKNMTRWTLIEIGQN